MNYYDIKLRLAGSLNNEVNKHNVSAPEVMLLNALHGGGAVVSLAPAAAGAKRDVSNPRNMRVEMMRRYACDPRRGGKKSHIEAFQGLFGAGDAQPLPETVTMADLIQQPDEDVEDEVLDAKPKQTRKPKAKASANEDQEARALILQSLDELDAEYDAKADTETLRAALVDAQAALHGRSALE
jgi:hypothetical protein